MVPKTTSPNGSDAARLLASGYRTLRFPEPLESEFRAEYRGRVRFWCRLAIIISACTVTGYTILDHFVLSAEHARITNLVRFGLHVPAVIMMLILTSKRFYTRWYGLGISIIAPVFGVGTVIMAAFSPPDEVPLVGGRMLLAHELSHTVQICHDAGLRCCVHAIGDRAFDMALDAYENAPAIPPTHFDQRTRERVVGRQLNQIGGDRLERRRQAATVKAAIVEPG